MSKSPVTGQLHGYAVQQRFRHHIRVSKPPETAEFSRFVIVIITSDGDET
jgi:hypothetical protein